MEVRLASVAAPGRSANEDHAFAFGELVGVLDGVTQPQGVDSGCRHGPAWYVRRLAARLGEVFAAMPSASPPQLLSDAIDAVRGDHEGRCDLGHPSTPGSTVCLLRSTGDRAEYLVLCDSTLILDHGGQVAVIADERFGRTIARIQDREPIPGAATATGDRAGRVRGFTIEKHQYTNQPGGYWIAAANPQAAFEAIAGEAPLHGSKSIQRAALLTDGASCAVDQFHLFDWSTMLDLVTDQGPAELIRRVRSAECSNPNGYSRLRYKRHDDATVALCLFSEEQP